MEESSRLKKFKEELITSIPFFPNNGESKNELRTQDLNSIVIHYLHWQTRLIPARPRIIKISNEAMQDIRRNSLKKNILKLLKKVEKGEDLSPYLSKKAHSKGYSPRKNSAWEDKDQILNVYGFHHFHLGMKIQPSGLSERTDDVLFAVISRNEFHAIGVFNHGVFDSPNEPISLTSEKERMLKVYAQYATQGMEPGSGFLTGPIMTSGHPFFIIRMADEICDFMRKNDSDLDNRPYVNNLYNNANIPPPKKFKLEWYFQDLDLGVLDKKTRTFFSFFPGPI